MKNSAELIYANSRTVNEKILHSNEQAYYDQFVNAGNSDEKYNEEVRRKRQESKTMSDMDSFSDIHEELKLNRDKKKLKELRDRGVEMDKTQRAEIFETLMAQNIEKADWFDGAYVSETLEYDDRVNHTDFVLEWAGEEEDDESIKLAIDTTVAENSENLRKKSDFIKSDLRSGKLTSIDYFYSSLDEEKRVLTQIPRVVLVLEKDALESLCEKAMADKKGEELSKDYLQLIMIKEIIDQLEEQINFLESKGLKNADKIKKVLDKILEVYENKKSSLGESDAERAEEDLVLMKKKYASIIFSYSD